MEEWHPKSDEELHQTQHRKKKIDNGFGCLMVLTVVAGLVFGAVLQIQVTVNFFKTWPQPIRFLTTPPGMVLVFLGLLLLVLKTLPYTRRIESMRPLWIAVGNYDRGRQAYKQWEKNRKKRDLAKSRQYLQSARWCLKDVPEYMELWKKVEEAVSGDIYDK